MLKFSEQKAILTHINTREEKHGPEELVLAVDLTFKADVSNDFLSELSPTLKWSLYDKPEAQDLAQDAGYMPHLRYPFMADLDWGETLVGATVVIHGLKKGRDLEFEAKVNKLALNCKEGGTVTVTWRVQTPIVPEQLGALAALLSRDVPVSITPASADLTGGGAEA